MAKRRKLKKTADCLCGELFDACMAIGMNKKDAPREELNGVAADILRLWGDVTVAIGKPEPGLPARKYFAALRKDTAKRVDEIVNRLNALV